MTRPGSIGMAVFVAALSVFGIATGLGLLRMKQWARISTLILAGFMAVMSLSAMALLATVSPEHPGRVRADRIALWFLIRNKPAFQRVGATA